MLVLFWSIVIIIGWWQISRLSWLERPRELLLFVVFQIISGIYGTAVILDIFRLSPFQMIVDFFN